MNFDGVNRLHEQKATAVNLTGQGNFGDRARPAGILILLAMLSIGLLSGCGQDDTPPPTAEGPSSTQPVAGGTAVIALSGEPDALNPLVFSTATAGVVFSEIHDGLTYMDDDLNYVPRIAKGWEVGGDGLSITYFLNHWVWSDGEPLTAYDVASSLEMFLDPVVASPRRGRLREVKSATALDSLTVRYDFKRPQSEPLARSWHHILPQHLVGQLDRAQVASWPINSQPLASGEFQLERWERNRSLTLVRNPHFPGTAPWLKRVVFSILPESNTRMVALETGDVDVVDSLDPDAAQRLAATGRFTITSVGGRRFYYLGWNFRNPIFADRTTREALSLAIDRELMVATLLKGYGKPATTPIAPVLWNHNKNLVAPPHDPAKSRRLLAEAGWRDEDGDGVLERNGREFSFEIITKQGDPVRENGAVILRANLAEVGVKVNLRVMEHTAGLAQVQAGRYDAFLGLLNANLFGNPAGYVQSDATDQFNHGHYSNATVDSLLEVATGLRERDEALPVWWRLQEELMKDQPAAYLMYPDNLVGVSKRLQNVKPSLLSTFNNLAEWWIAPEDRIYRTN